MKSFPKSAKDLAAYYPSYAALIHDGLWYADHTQLDESFWDSWAVQNVTQGIADASDAPYWKPRSPQLVAQMKSTVHKKQYAGGFTAARSLGGKPRKPEDFRRFSVGYDYSCRYDGPERAGVEVARILGDALVDDTVRLSRLSKHECKLYVERANYLDQVATNINCDTSFEDPIHFAQTFRELDRENSTALQPLERCSQANTIGVACVFFGADGIPVLARRSGSVEVMNDKVGARHCTASGVLTWQDMLSNDGQGPSLSILGIRRGMQREIYEELRLQPSEYTLQITDFARELPRAGKPQFFFFAQHNAPAEELAQEIAARVPEAEGAWERENTRSRTLLWTPAANRDGGLVVDFDLHVSAVTLSQLSKTKNKFTYEGYSALLFAVQAATRPSAKGS